MYKLYGAHRHGVQELERELAVQRETEELMKAQFSEIPNLSVSFFFYIDYYTDSFFFIMNF